MINDLPKNADAERNLIGLVLLDKQIPESAKLLSTLDFYEMNYRLAWTAFLELEMDGREIEPFAVAEIMKRCGSNWSITELTNTTIGMVSVNPKVFVKKIQDAATRRRVIKKLYDSIEKVNTGDFGITDLRRELSDIEAESYAPSTFRSLSDVLVQDVAPALHDLHEGKTNKLSTGFDSIDTAIGGGLSPSDVLLIAALPAAGKSALVLKLATNLAKANIPVAYVSGEMSDKENAMRLLSQAANQTNLNSLTHLYDDEYAYYQKWLEHQKFTELPIYFNSSTSDLQTLSKSLRVMIEATGIKVLIIDYIQLFKTSKSDRTTRTERIAEVSQEVKRLAMEFGLCVIAVAQFNRDGAKSGKPGMHDLEGSSQLEKDASLIFIIDREENSEDIELRIVKGRNTRVAKLEGKFTGRTLNFEF